MKELNHYWPMLLPYKTSQLIWKAEQLTDWFVYVEKIGR